MMLLLDENDLRGKFIQKLNSGDWWLILPTGSGLAWLSSLEADCYSKPGAAADFEMILGWLPPGGPVLFGCVFAHKRRCSPLKMAKRLGRKDLPLKRDIICLSATGAEAELVLNAFSAWIGPDIIQK